MAERSWLMRQELPGGAPALSSPRNEQQHEQQRPDRAELANRVLDALDWPAIARTLSLSTREVQVVRQILLGEKLQRIAQGLSLGVGTVRTYAARVRAKLDVHDHLELMLVVLGAGLPWQSHGEPVNRLALEADRRAVSILRCPPRG